MPSSSASFELCHVLLLAASKRATRISIRGPRHSFSSSLSTCLLSSNSNNVDGISNRLSDLNREIIQLNNGNPINLRSPKQVSTAIFGQPQTATQSVLMKVASVEEDPQSEYTDLPDEKRVLAKLIFEYRALVKEMKQNANNAGSSDQSRGQKEQKESQNGNDDSTISVGSVTEHKQQRKPPQKQPTNEELVETLFAGPKSKIDPYWKEALLQLSKSTARTLLHQLDPYLCPMGFDPSAVPRRTNKKPPAISTAGKKGSFLSFCRIQKEEYPQCIMLVRCGDFYETFGIDAIMLVEHLGLNSMGGKVKAGCPYRNIQPTLNGLTQQGFSVAVYEEMGTVENNKLKSRFLSQIVSPASPTYLYDNWLLGGGEHDQQHGSLEGLPPSRPCVGIVQTAAGYNLVEVSLEERSVEYSERLTPEAVACRLAAFPPADPLIFIPSPAEMASPSALSLPFLPNGRVPAAADGGEATVESSLGGFRIRTKVLPPHLIQKPSPGVSDADRYIKAIVEKLIDLNEAHFDRPQEEDSRYKRPTVDDFLISMTTTATNPLYVETASQLGLLKTPSIPPLTAFVLDEAAPAATRRFLQRYLLIPPPPEIAKAMSELVGSQMNPYASPLPPLMVPPLGKVLSLVRAGQASANIYGDLLQSLSTAQLLLTSENESLPTNSLLALCAHESGLPCTRNSLVERCQNALDSIEAVISPAFHVGNADAAHDEEIYDSVTDDLYVSTAFFERNEATWRGRVQPQVARDAYEKVAEAAHRFRDAITSDYIGDDDSNKALIIHDFYNNLIALKKIPNTNLKEGDYFHPRDRFGKTLRNRYTTEGVQCALADYISACEIACDSVSSVLSNLAQNIEENGHIPAIVQATHLNLVMSAAYHHAVKASKLKWNLARVVEDDGEHNSMNIVDVWPYWMERSQAVANTFDLNGLFLLTAPNMSGKSTLMRSTAAAALLSVCGFCAPLGAGSTIPRFDTLFLRGASADIPTEDKSAFGAEMGDIAALMRCCGPKSLIFVDELGRGTSPRDGTRLAGAVLEAMAQRGMSGIFATHLHDILELPLDRRDRIINKRLAIEEQDGSYEWTYLLEDGVCKDSLALLTAARFGLPEEIIRRAEELAEHLPEARSFANKNGANQGDESMSTLSESPPVKSRPATRMSENQQQEELDFQRAIALAEDLTGQVSIPIPPRWNPPPALCNNQSCVYMIELKANPPKYYVGETDALLQRLKKHRSKGEPWSASRAVAMPVADKSEARAWESRLIQKLAQNGFRMESITDGRTLRHLQ